MKLFILSNAPFVFKRIGKETTAEAQYEFLNEQQNSFWQSGKHRSALLVSLPS